MNGIYVKLNIAQLTVKVYTNFKASEWPAKIKSFMTTQPISQKVPGKSLSISYGKRVDKYLRNYTLNECYDIFKCQNPKFQYKFSMFSSVVPKKCQTAY